MAQGKMTYTDEELLDIIEDSISGPAFYAKELAEIVDMTVQGVRTRLEQLNENGKIGKKKPGSRTIIYWDRRDYRSSEFSR
jgi:predicted transcriptional regulator